MVMMRFGSITDFTHPKLSYSKIAKRMFRQPNTVHYAIKNFVKESQVIDHRRNNGKHVQYQIVRHQLHDYILDRNTLVEWSGYSLQDRVLLLEQKKGVTISWQALRRFYLKNNVRFLQSNYIY